jgi:hypothetical protein
MGIIQIGGNREIHAFSSRPSEKGVDSSKCVFHVYSWWPTEKGVDSSKCPLTFCTGVPSAAPITSSASSPNVNFFTTVEPLAAAFFTFASFLLAATTFFGADFVLVPDFFWDSGSLGFYVGDSRWLAVVCFRTYTFGKCERHAFF